MSQGPCGLDGGPFCAAGAAVAVANVTPSGRSASAVAAARVLRRVGRVGGLHKSGEVLLFLFLFWPGPVGRGGAHSAAIPPNGHVPIGDCVGGSGPAGNTAP